VTALSPHVDPAIDTLVPCRCCGIVNVDPAFLDAFEHLRFLADEPILFDCLCRCPRHNAEVKGAPRSEHLTTAIRAARAGDIRALHLPLTKLYYLALRVPAFDRGGIGLYPDSRFLHVDVRDDGPARWGELAGRRKVELLAALEIQLARESAIAGKPAREA